MFMSKGDQVKPWSSVQFLIIISSLVTFALFYFQYFKPKITKNLVTYFVYFGFVNLRAVGAWQLPQMQSCLFTVAGWLKSEEKEPTLGFPESSIITLSHACGKTSLAASL
jgi:hypothetical protein